MSKAGRTFVFIILLTIGASFIALPEKFPLRLNFFGRTVETTLAQPHFNTTFMGRPLVTPIFKLKQGLDIQGGMQVVLQADMSTIAEVDRVSALASAKEIIARRVDLYGIGESVIQTSQYGNEYRLLVELPGVQNVEEALRLVGTTAQLDFRLETPETATATESAVAYLNTFQPTTLTGQQLKRAAVQFDPQTNEPVISLEFSPEGTEIFAKLTTENTNKVMAIFIDGYPVAVPRINTPILTGQALLSGGFTIDQAKQLAVQLNAGALPVPITVIQQRTIGASLGQTSVQQSLRAGVIGIGLVIFFMIAYYGWQGLIATIALLIYSVLTIAAYKIIGITLTLPGIAGLVLSIGMAVDSNILIFERMKEELRIGRPFSHAMELGFGRAWASIKDANLATIMIAFILINPLNFSFLNTSGLVRGFGVTLLTGIVISLFTGIVVTRTLMRLFLKEPTHV